MWLKACTKCGGDLYEQALLGEKEIVCLQCGRSVYMTVMKNTTPRLQEVSSTQRTRVVA